MFKCLVDKGIDLNPHSGFNERIKPLAIAAEISSPQVIKLLINLGADPDGLNAYWDTALIYALMKNRREIVVTLVENGANVNMPNAFGMSPFLGICNDGDLELVKFFIKHDADVNSGYKKFISSENATAPPVEYITPLMMAAQGGKKEVIKLLIKHGADIKAKDSVGEMAIDYAKNAGHKHLIELLDK